eukprot:scaffold375721_cov45-Prasinocladus_malaysianus.AAC.1
MPCRFSITVAQIEWLADLEPCALYAEKKSLGARVEPTSNESWLPLTSSISLIESPADDAKWCIAPAYSCRIPSCFEVA